MKHLIVAILSLLISLPCQGQNSHSEKLTEFKFESIFGSRASEPEITYCLLGTGFFRAPRSQDSDSLIISWVKKHPDAIVVPVSSFGPTEIDSPISSMTYCWIVHQKDTLNNYLIREGCFPGWTMLRPRTWEELEEWEREIYEDLGEKNDIQLLVDNETYDRFIEQIKIAERVAKEAKRGVWKELN